MPSGSGLASEPPAAANQFALVPGDCHGPLRCHESAARYQVRLLAMYLALTQEC
jgi:hypothetical protein